MFVLTPIQLVLSETMNGPFFTTNWSLTTVKEGGLYKLIADAITYGGLRCTIEHSVIPDEAEGASVTGLLKQIGIVPHSWIDQAEWELKAIDDKLGLPELRVVFWDIEILGTIVDASLPLVAFPDSDLNRITTICLILKNGESLNRIVLEGMPEAELISTFFKHLEEFQPDYHVTYSGDLFDVPYLLARATALGLDVPRGPFSLVNTPGGQVLKETLAIPSLDLLLWYRLTLEGVKDHRLDTVASHFLGKGKTDSIKEVFRAMIDGESVGTYCLNDCELLVDLFTREVEEMFSRSNQVLLPIQEYLRSTKTHIIDAAAVTIGSEVEAWLPLELPEPKRHRGVKRVRLVTTISSDPGLLKLMPLLPEKMYSTLLESPYAEENSSEYLLTHGGYGFESSPGSSDSLAILDSRAFAIISDGKIEYIGSSYLHSCPFLQEAVKGYLIGLDALSPLTFPDDFWIRRRVWGNSMKTLDLELRQDLTNLPATTWVDVEYIWLEGVRRPVMKQLLDSSDEEKEDTERYALMLLEAVRQLELENV